MAAPVIKLKHTFFEGDRTLYFYEGETEVVGGVVTIPTDRPEWAQRAWIKGYRRNVESGDTRTLQDILDECAYKMQREKRRRIA